MKEVLLDNGLEEVYKTFDQDHDHLYEKLMVSIFDHLEHSEQMEHVPIQECEDI